MTVRACIAAKRADCMQQRCGLLTIVRCAWLHDGSTFFLSLLTWQPLRLLPNAHTIGACADNGAQAHHRAFLFGE